MAEGFVHTVYKGGQWLNEIEGGAEFGGSHSTKGNRRLLPAVPGRCRMEPSM